MDDQKEQQPADLSTVHADELAKEQPAAQDAGAAGGEEASGDQVDAGEQQPDVA